MYISPPSTPHSVWKSNIRKSYTIFRIKNKNVMLEKLKMQQDPLKLDFKLKYSKISVMATLYTGNNPEIATAKSICCHNRVWKKILFFTKTVFFKVEFVFALQIQTYPFKSLQKTVDNPISTCPTCSLN